MNDNTNKNLMIIAGEVSGDLHGASLVKELKSIDHGLNICGIGGEKMKEAGMEILFHINSMAFLGFLEVVRHIPFIKKVQKNLLSVIDERNINNAVLIDYPGFNLNFAGKLKARGIKIFYYISPQIWAWRMSRIKKIKKLISKMLVVFPFEEAMYKKEGVDTEFTGHPLIERIDSYNFLSRENLYSKFNLEPDKQLLLILPGSREHEVKKIFPAAIEAAVKLSDEFNLQVITICSENIDENLFYGLTSIRDFKVVKGFTYDFMKYAKFGIVKSGTSTLEAGIFALPMIIVYRTSAVTYFIGKKLVHLDNIGMANIISGENIVPELIQDKASADLIYSTGKKILSDNSLYSDMKVKLENIKNKLGVAGASRKAAEIIYRSMNED